jgi:hypothetical protein
MNPVDSVKATLLPCWLIWSTEHDRWWMPNRCGYTHDREAAGRYTFYQACEIVGSANVHLDAGLQRRPNESMILDEEALA